MSFSDDPARAGDGIGAPLLRREDRRFLTGRGRFLDDIDLPGALHCAFVRSPHAHARIDAIDANAARAMPGVSAVLTGADMEADGIGAMLCAWPIKWADGRDMPEPPRWALARGVVRHVGEPVAMVIAESRSAAVDAAEAIAIDWGELPAVSEAPKALLKGAPRIHEEAVGNVCFHFRRGDTAATDAAFGTAAETVTLDLVNHRLACAAIEPRATAALWDPDRQALTLHTTTQTPHLIRRAVAEQLDLPESDLRVISPDVGGGFGMKGKHYPEETAVAWAARKLGRLVRWSGDRSEAFVSDTQARDHHTRAELALDADGRYLGLRVRTIANVGAYVSTYGAAIPSAIYSGLLAGVYATPAIDIEITGVFTNSVPTDAYRGAGRPEACYVLERLTDAAAAKLGIDRVELRRRNMIPAAAMPYTTPIGPTYDSGDFPRILEGAVKAADYAGFAARRDKTADDGKLRGIGVAAFVESSGVAPSRLAGMMGARGGLFESAEIRVDA
ncbi:MAG: xanthine dehydrogenase family protein, partial [Bauldia litoralis]